MDVLRRSGTGRCRVLFLEVADDRTGESAAPELPLRGVPSYAIPHRT